MICFLLETRKVLLDHLVRMHDQYVTEICRQSKNAYEQKHRDLRKQQKKAVDLLLDTTTLLLDWPDDKPILKPDLWQRTSELEFRAALDDLRRFQQLEERGYGDLLLARYPSLRKYFADFLQLPFAAEHGSDPLIKSIGLIRQLDANERKQLEADTPIAFMPKELRRALKDVRGNINRNAWEMGLALALKDALRSGDLYLPQSKQHVSFWDFMLSDADWQATKAASYVELQQPQPQEASEKLIQHFHENVIKATKQFPIDTFAEIHDGQLKLKRDDKAPVPDAVAKLQRVIDASLPSIRIEQLLMEVDQLTQFSQQFIPIQGHHARPSHFYKTLMAGLISQATNLGVVAMSASVKGVSVDMLRHVLQFFVREETLKAASAEIVNRHHELPLSTVHGRGAISIASPKRRSIAISSKAPFPLYAAFQGEMHTPQVLHLAAYALLM